MTYYSETPREGISLPDGTFKGVLKDGKPSWGTLTDLCGIIYEGEFQDGKIQGKGIMTFPEGQRYEGDFVNESSRDPVCILGQTETDTKANLQTANSKVAVSTRGQTENATKVIS